MTDRVPGAPGQYKAVISAAELLKMQSGGQFTITMTRDDQPITVGTPYNKASVLPDDLAQTICPAVVDPTPADALRGLAGSRQNVVLTKAGWVNKRQTAAVAGVTEANTVIVGPEPEKTNYDAYNDAGIRCVAQGEGTLTFVCEEVPEGSVTACAAVFV